MASRSASRCLRSFLSKSSSSPRPSFSIPSSSNTSRTTSRFASSFSRMPVELGVMSGMLPFHSAVAEARLTARLSDSSISCRALTQGILCCTSPGL